jgi:predicted nucleotidyltransferase
VKTPPRSSAKQGIYKMQLKGIISMSEFYELTEEIAQLIDDKLNTDIDDLSNINDLIEKQIQVAYNAQQVENIQVNGG